MSALQMASFESVSAETETSIPVTDQHVEEGGGYPVVTVNGQQQEADIWDRITTNPTRFETAPSLMGAYEGTNRTSKQLMRWNPPLRHVDADVLPEKNTADSRSIDLTRNDAYAQAGINLHRNSIVGPQYRLNCKPALKVLGLDEMWEKEFAEEVETRFRLYAESPDMWIDASRRNTFTMLARLAVAQYLMHGEVLAAVEWVRTVRRPYHTAIQMVSPDRLTNPNNRYSPLGKVRGGIETDIRGAPIAYYIRKSSPGVLYNMRDYEWDRVKRYGPMGRLQVLHIMEQQRAGQTRGVGALVAALKETRIARKFREVTLENAIVNATFAAVVTSDLPKDAVMESISGMGGGADAVRDYAVDYLTDVSKYTEKSKNIKIDGTKIPVLYPGTELDVKPVGTPGGVGQDFEMSLIRYLAAALGVSYEELSKDYTSTTYSSARAAGVETWKHMSSMKANIVDTFCTQIYKLWFEEAVNAGHISAMNYSKVPNMYEPLVMDALTRCRWVGPSRGQIDPVKETQAMILRVKGGFTTMESEVAGLGGDWESDAMQAKREVETFDSLGLTHPMKADIQLAEVGKEEKEETRKENRK